MCQFRIVCLPAFFIFLCASALGSTHILLNSKSPRFPDGLGNSSGVLGHYLMDHHCEVGSTAEMPGFYPRGEYDLAGFIVGVVEKSKIITGDQVAVGDVLVGLPSSGLHTNGYSLARKLFFDVAKYTPETYVSEIKGKAGTELMHTHKSYWPVLKKLIAADLVHAMAHITGGGITDNLPRVLPKGTGAVVEMGTWPVLPLFTHMQHIGNVPQDEMMRTFNMGIGMVLVVPAKKFKRVQSIVEKAGEKAHLIGRIVKGDRKVQKVAKAGKLAKKELDDLSKQVDFLKRQLQKTVRRLKRALS